MKKIKLRNSVISDMKLNTKMLVISSLAVISSLIVIIAMVRGIYTSQEKKHNEMQTTIITASEQLMEMTVESGVNIAKSIYINDNIYSFLNTEYNSSSEYYDAFYNLKNKNPMSMADTNIINKCIVYTENPTILTGGNISAFTPVLNTEWYHEYRKLDKPMILYVDSETDTVSIIRRLDFQNLNTGESCLKLDLNMKLLSEYCDNLDFNGELYIINGGSLIYSNVPDMTIENTGINPDFECYIKNYYTSDIEYYAYEYRIPFTAFLHENLLFIVIFVVLLATMIISGYIFVADIKKRLYRSANELTSEKKRLNNSGNGADEIGTFIDICIKVAEKLAVRNSDYRRTHEEFQETSSRYNELFSTAMKLDAELAISEKYPKILRKHSEYITFEEEALNIRHVTHNITFSGKTDIKIPAYSLMMIAEDLSDKSLSADIIQNKNNVIITFSRNAIHDPAKILKLYAIFEESEITDRYSFIPDNSYNAYMRLVHYFGDMISIKIDNKINFRLYITINSEKSDLI
ncbi:MAG: hypothetical protein K2H26_01475 [Ruminococcus sp.]|nr:hypothetical protein [Ruminococcus sp.]